MFVHRLKALLFENCVYREAMMILFYLTYAELSMLIDNLCGIGYEPPDLTVHPYPRTAEGGFIFFV